MSSLRDDTLIAGWNMPTYLLNADWSTYGHVFTVASILPPTGTLLDNTMLMTLSAARSLARARAARKMQHHTAPANPSSPGKEALPEEEPGEAVSAVLIRTVDGMDLQEMSIQLGRLHGDLDVITAPAYAQSLRRHVRQMQRVVDACGVITLLLAGMLGVTAVWPYRRTDKSYAPSATQAAFPKTAYPQIPPSPLYERGEEKEECLKPLPGGRNMPWQRL